MNVEEWDSDPEANQSTVQKASSMDSGDEGEQSSRSRGSLNLHRHKRRKTLISSRSTSTGEPEVLEPEEGEGDKSSAPHKISTALSGTTLFHTPFEEVINDLLPDLLNSRADWLIKHGGVDEQGLSLRPMTRLELLQNIQEIEECNQGGQGLSVPDALLRRKMKLILQNGYRRYTQKRGPITSLTPLEPQPAMVAADPDVLNALHAIRTTPYESSFAARLMGTYAERKAGLLASDWDSHPSWLDVMDDVREHHKLSRPEDELGDKVNAPIDYTSLEYWHLPQVHELLERSFWPGIDVSDSMDYSPEKCTIVALYKRLVVGVAIMSSPQETYITYLCVRSGWDNAHIATSMLFHLISLNPRKDINLHVSANNPAMLLYNRFGFKAEEFIVGFYEDYLSHQSRASKNAFRLRLRQ